jgi:regulator of replication initiation timing
MEQLRKLEAEYESLMKDCERLIAENEELRRTNGELRARILELERKFGLDGITPEPEFSSRAVREMSDQEYGDRRAEIMRARREDKFLYNSSPARDRWRRKLKIVEE